MPYKAGERLPGERASKLGHLDVLKSPLVRRLCDSFEDPQHAPLSVQPTWQTVPAVGDPLRIVFGVDGSLQVIESETRPHKTIAFVKTALLRLDQAAISQIDKDSPHPFALRDILADSALYHATVFPLRHVIIAGISTYDTIRQIIFESVKDASLNGEPMATLKWLAYEQWDGKKKSLPLFECPHCGHGRSNATLPYDAEEGTCGDCSGRLFLTDMLGFHQEMAIDSAPDSIASSYMAIHETLLLFTGIRYFWETNRDALSHCLFVKDGPLSIRAQYSKLVAPIRRFFEYARHEGVIVHVIGQEKSGAFFEHLQLIEKHAPESSIFIPGDLYIKEEIQHRPSAGAPYGKDTNYGAKVFLKLNEFHHAVLNIPIGKFEQNPQKSDLIGIDRILGTLPRILSNRYEGALLPIELANGVASLSTYPSAHILKIFAESSTKRGVP